MTGKELENESLQAMPAKEKEQMMEQLRILWYAKFIQGIDWVKLYSVLG